MRGKKTAPATPKAANPHTPKPPTNLGEANNVIAGIAETQRALDAINGRLNTRVTRLQEAAMTASQPLQTRLDELIAGLLRFATPRRAQLLAGGEKSVALPSGTFGWRLGSPAVRITTSEEAVIAACRALGLQEFIRIPPAELDKQAILKERDGKAKVITGVEFAQGETFFIKPVGLETQLTKKIAPETAQEAAPAA